MRKAVRDGRGAQWRLRLGARLAIAVHVHICHEYSQTGQWVGQNLRGLLPRVLGGYHASLRYKSS